MRNRFTAGVTEPSSISLRFRDRPLGVETSVIVLLGWGGAGGVDELLFLSPRL